ncbi:serine/threonine-protein kinase [Xylaria acuta]|nr:serine/threonine-protein kinase [Xylaria acuta]
MPTAVITDKDNEAARASIYSDSPRPLKRARLDDTQTDALSATTTTTVTTTIATTTATASSHIANSPVQPVLAHPQLHLGQFEIAKSLGKGSFGRVYLAKHKESGRICALKILNKESITRAGNERHVRREIEVHSQLRHPGILNFYGWFHDSSRIVMILEYAIGGELFGVLQREGEFSEQCAAKYVAQVAISLSYLHRKHIMHRDIKPENILLGLHGELKLADFGYSVYAPDDRRETRCGTLDYLPPEMLTSSHLSYTNAVDLWALGVLTYEFLTGGAPFTDTAAATRRRIRELDMEPLPDSLSSEAKDFVHSLLVLDPSSRLSLKGVLDHPWITKNCNSPG